MWGEIEAEPKWKKMEKWGDRQKALLRTSFVVSNPRFVSDFLLQHTGRYFYDIFDKIDICQCISTFFSFSPVMISLFLFFKLLREMLSLYGTTFIFNIPCADSAILEATKTRDWVIVSAGGPNKAFLLLFGAYSKLS